MSLGAKRRLPVVQGPYNHGPIYIYISIYIRGHGHNAVADGL